MADDEQKKEENVLTEDEKQQMQKDIEEARSSIVASDVDKKIADAKADVIKEMELKKEAEDARAKSEELAKQLADSQKNAAEQLDSLKKKVDDMSVSKAPAKMEDPFSNMQNAPEGSHPVDRLNDGDIDEMEKRSAEEFFGPDYNRMLNQETNR